VFYLSGCWIISAFEIHSRFHSLIMTVFAHDVAKKEGERISVITKKMEKWRDILNDTQIHTKNLNCIMSA